MKPSKFLKKCLSCGNDFWAIPSKVAAGKDKYCSKECYASLIKGKILSPGSLYVSEDTIGKNNFRWKGDKISYSGLHDYIRYHLGSANSRKCEKCGAEDRWMHWSNISREYKRDLNDWEALCVPCHKKKDLA